MKTQSLLAVSLIAAACLCAATARATDIVVTNVGNWSSTIPDAPWPDGIVPGPNDDVDVEAPGVITVDTTNALTQYIYGSGAIIMGPNSVLNIIGDPVGAQGTYQLATLDASAVGNTVIYSGNPFWAKHQDYYHLIFSNATTNQLDFFNGLVNSQDPAAAMTVAGDMTVIGKIKVQMGADFTIGGNLLIGTNSSWDCSGSYFTVASNVTVGGLLLDLNGALGSNYIGGNLTVTAGALGWNVSDVTHWALGGSLTNNGNIVGKGYGSITFDGTGTITGSKPIKIPTMTVNGTYTIANTIILTTNTPNLNGTLVFDLANTNQIVLQTYLANPLTNYYGGNLNVINSGPPPVAGNSYQLFVAGSYDGAFTSQTFPPLAGGLSWEDHLLASGSISVAGSVVVPPPNITAFQYAPVSHQFTLTWTSVPATTYSVLLSTNLKSGFDSILATGIPSGGNSTTNTVTMPNGNAGFVKIRQP
jgi:hypothetical protein